MFYEGGCPIIEMHLEIIFWKYESLLPKTNELKIKASFVLKRLSLQRHNVRYFCHQLNHIDDSGLHVIGGFLSLQFHPRKLLYGLP